MGHGVEFDFDRLRWWRFIDRNAHSNPDANSNAFRHAVCNPHPRCNAFANAICDANTDAYPNSRSNADRSRMSDW